MFWPTMWQSSGLKDTKVRHIISISVT